jgi:hypothetical protein
MNEPSWTDILLTGAVVAALLFTGWEIRARVPRPARFTLFPLDSEVG